MRTRLKIAAAVVGAFVTGLAVAPASVQAAVNYFDATRVVNGYAGSATCPYNWRLTGGGSYPLPGNSYSSSLSTEYALTGSYPSSATSWRTSGTVTRGTYSSSSGWRFSTSSYSPRAYAICAD